MPIRNITSDYTNRLRDISILQYPDVSQAQTVRAGISGAVQYCSGIQKLVQQYTIALLTILGSQPKFPDFGTLFIPSLTGSTNRLLTAERIRIAFSFANHKLIKDFRKTQSQEPVPPLDEQLRLAVLENISGSGDTINMTIRIIPMSGNDTDFVLPLPLQQ